ncbi:MAG: aromatic-ring-hydroxylating dioxygenase subunit beta, partial [Burkholderiales bacterium]
MITADERFAIYDLYADYANRLDDFRLDSWLELFVEDCLYRIVPRENYVANLPLSLVLCDSKDMLRDRVVALQQANEYNIHTDRHLVSSVKVKRCDDGIIFVDASFAVFQVNTEGEA